MIQEQRDKLLKVGARERGVGGRLEVDFTMTTPR